MEIVRAGRTRPSSSVSSNTLSPVWLRKSATTIVSFSLSAETLRCSSKSRHDDGMQTAATRARRSNSLRRPTCEWGQSPAPVRRALPQPDRRSRHRLRSGREATLRIFRSAPAWRRGPPGSVMILEWIRPRGRHRDGFRDNWCEKTIATARNCLHVDRPIGIVVQRTPDLLNALIHPVLKVNEGVIAPDLLLDFLPGHDLAGVAGQQGQQSERLRR